MLTDYSKSNDQIVRQTYDVSQAVLTETQVQRLFHDKINRAAAMIRAQEQFKKLAQED